ncbi:MAG: signal peptidase I [Bacillota bacterium]
MTKNKNAIKKVFSGTGKIINIMLIVIFIILLVFNIYKFVSSTFYDNKMPKLFGFASAVVVSGSMSGSIEVGDYIIIKESKSYEKDDVVTFTKDNMLITHRIIEVTEEGYITKGDANTVDDGEIYFEQIEGKVVLIIPKIGLVVKHIMTPYGIFICIIVILVFAVIQSNKTEGKNKKEDEKTDD